MSRLVLFLFLHFNIRRPYPLDSGHISRVLTALGADIELARISYYT